MINQEVSKSLVCFSCFIRFLVLDTFVIVYMKIIRMNFKCMSVCGFRSFLMLLLVSLAVVGCKEDIKEDAFDSNVLVFDAKTASFVNLENIIKSPKFVPLQLTEESGIFRISKAEILGENIYLLDPELNKVLSYNKSGEFVLTISNPGEGPNELDMIVDFCVNDDNETIELLSPKGKVVSFDPERGEYVSIINRVGLLSPSYGFARVSDDHFAFYNNLGDFLVKEYSVGKREVVKSMLPNELFAEVDWHSIHPFKWRSDKLSLLEMLTSTIYGRDPNGDWGEKWRFDFSEQNFPLDSVTLAEIRAVGDLWPVLEMRNSLYPVSDYYEDANFVYLRLLEAATRQKILLYNKINKNWKIADVTKSGDITLNLSDGFGYRIGVINDPMEFQMSHPEIIQAGEGWPEINVLTEPNPVLFFYKPIVK